MTIANHDRKPAPPAFGLGFAVALAVGSSLALGAGPAQAQATPQAEATQQAEETSQAKASPQVKAGADEPNRSGSVVDGLDRVGDAAERIVERPLRDLNIIKPKPQPVLEAVMASPYSMTGLRTCRQYRAEIAKLTEVLGPDVDSAVATDPDRKESPAEFALGAGEAVAVSLIPGGGLIRKISGADKRQKYAAAGVYAGSVRRAYVKGLMLGKNCRR